MKHLPIYNRQYKAYLRDYQLHIQRLGYNKSCQQSLPSQMREFFNWLEKQGMPQIEKVTPQIIKQHYEYLAERPNETRPGGISDSSLAHHMWAIKTFFTYQEANGVITSNPFSSITFPKAEIKPREVLTPQEIKALYNACENYKDRAVLGLFYGCGLRRSEVVQLNVADVNFNSQVLYIRSGKNKKRRVVPISTNVAKDLNNYYQFERDLHWHRYVSDSFILNSWGDRMLGDNHWKRFKYLIRNAGLPEHFSLHHLRHSIATHLLEEGVSIEQVRDFLGHGFLETTQIYTRVSSKYLVNNL